MNNSQNLKKADKVFKWLGIIWSILAFIIVVTFFAGGEWQKWTKVKTVILTKDWDEFVSKLSELESIQKNVKTNSNRISGIKLIAIDAGTDTFGCGGEGKAEKSTLKVMYGSRDGTSCKVSNVNYYKKLVLEVPD